LAVRQAAASPARFAKYCAALTRSGKMSPRVVTVGLKSLVLTVIEQAALALTFAEQAALALVYAVQALYELERFSQMIPAVAEDENCCLASPVV